MKKKIVALALLLCMLVGILSGCAYSYAEDDMSQYVTTSAEDLKVWLKDLTITDGDFTTDEQTRQKKVADAIMTSLAALGESKTAGKVDAGDKLTYRYFALLTSDLSDTELNLLDYDDLAARALFASNMTATAQTAILGLNYASDFEKALFEAVKNYTFAESTNYATKSSDTVVALDDVIFASFKRTYKDQNNNDVTETFTSVRLWNSKNTLADPAEYTPAPADILFDNFIGKKTTDTIADFTYTAEGVEYKCTEVKLNAIVKTPAAANTDANYGAPVVFKCKPYPDSTTQTAKSANGAEIKIGGVELTYFVYPISFSDSKKYDDCSAEFIIRELLKGDITADIFEDNLDRTAEGGITLEALINGDSTSTEAYMVDSLATIFSYIETPKNHADVTNNEKTEAEIKTLYEGYLTARIAKINTIAGANAMVRADYKESVYDSLEAAYVSDIKEKLADEFHHIIMEKIEIKKDENGNYILPKDAVDEIYDIFYENEKYTFNYGYDTTEASATYNQPYYQIYKGSFDKYLIANFTENGAGTAKDAKAAIRASAEEFVATSVKIHFAAKVFDALISDEDFDERYENWYANWQYQSQIYAYMGYSYPDPGKTGMRLAFQAQDLYDTLLYVKGEKDAIDAYLKAYEKDPESATYNFDNVLYTTGDDGKLCLDFANIKYKLEK